MLNTLIGDQFAQSHGFVEQLLTEDLAPARPWNCSGAQHRCGHRTHTTCSLVRKQTTAKFTLDHGGIMEREKSRDSR